MSLRAACHALLVSVADRYALLRRRKRILMPIGNGLTGIMRPRQIREVSDLEIMDEVVHQDQYAVDTICSGDIVLDIGAQAGMYTLIASRRAGPTGRVVAIEPQSRNFRLLGMNVRYNKLTNVTRIHAALHSQSGSISLSVATDNNGGHSIVPSISHNVETVPTLSLQDIIKNSGINRIDVIKADCEGGEFFLFTSENKGILSRVRHIMLETHETPGTQHLGDTESICSYLHGLGFRTEVKQRFSYPDEGVFYLVHAHNTALIGRSS